VDWNDWIERRYGYLVAITSRWCSLPNDLVHHVYLRCIDKRFPENPEGYFLRACWIECTRGKFKKVYRIEERESLDKLQLPSEDDMTKAIQRETLEIWISRLNWFDKNLVQLYIEGYTMKELSEQTGIKAATLYKALERTRNTLTHAIRIRTGEDS
jgi:RNA polymerase sigma factor (sigma-70 family)